MGGGGGGGGNLAGAQKVSGNAVADEYLRFSDVSFFCG